MALATSKPRVSVIGRGVPATRGPMVHTTANTATPSTRTTGTVNKRIMTSAGNNPGGLRTTARNPFPSAPGKKRAAMTPGGPVLKKGPPTPGNAVRIIRGPGMARRAGTPKTGLRNLQTVQRIRGARENIRQKEGRRVINPAGPRKIIKTKGRTKIIGKNRVIIVTKRGSVVKNKKAGTVTRTKLLGKENPYSRTRTTVTGGGSKTATKADDWTAVKRSGQKGSRLIVKQESGRKVVVGRRKATPNKLRVRVIGPGGKTRMTRVVGPKFTKTTRGGKTVTKKTRMLTKEQSKKTARVGQKRWVRAGLGIKSKHMEKQPTFHEGPKGKGNWKKVHTIRRRRRRRGARFNQSVTKSQLKNQGARSY